MTSRLIARNLLSHPIRTLLTLFSLVVAIFLLVFLHSLIGALEAGVAGAASNRLVVQSAVSLFVNLPLSYQEKIEGVAGVEHVSKMQWFGGIYQDPKNFFAQFAVDPETFLEIYPEIDVIEGSVEEFHRDRTSCLVGRALQDRFGFQVGDVVPIIGTIFPRVDGSPWELHVVGIYSAPAGSVDESTIYFQFDYLDQAIESGVCSGPPGVGVFGLSISPGAEPTRVMAEVDQLFAGGPQRVQATTEAEFQRQFVSMLGNVPVFLGAIGGGVLFAIVLAALNTMLMAGRERMHDVGIMKALGFSDRHVFMLFMIEGVLLCGLGGALGVGASKLLESGFQAMLASQFPGFEIRESTMLMGFGVSLVIGLLAGAIPALGASRLGPVQALRAEG